MIAPGRRTLLAGLAAAAGTAGLGTLAGCGLLPRAATVPMPVQRLPGPCAGRADDLVVMLPGAYSRPAEFIDEGFVDALRARGVAADVWIADAHPGYFRNGSVVERLRADVIAPARAQGYRRTWLVGISLGGFGALACGLHQGRDLAGIVALAPYLGRPALLQAISAAGGPTAWQRQPATAATADVADGADAAAAAEARLWRWLAAPPPDAPPVYLGYGRDDALAPGHRLLAGLLPPDRVTVVPGGHDWPPWRALWQEWLSRGLLAPAGACAPARAPA